MAPLAASIGTGLQVDSVARFDKRATLHRSVITGKPGEAPSDWPRSRRMTCFRMFGLGQPREERAPPDIPA
jgi:hypothetical protein